MTEAGATYAACRMGNAADRATRLLTPGQCQQTVRTQHGAATPDTTGEALLGKECLHHGAHPGPPSKRVI